MTRPGGRPGRVGYDTGWMRRPCRTQDPRSEAFPSEVGSREETASDLKRCRSVAGVHAAHVVAIGIELANPTATAIAIRIRIAGSDRGTDDGGADEAGSDGPAGAAATAGVCRGGGRSEAAGDGESSKGERGDFGLDRHDKLHPVEARSVMVPHAGLDGGLPVPVRVASGESSVMRLIQQLQLLKNLGNSLPRSRRKRPRIEFVDVFQQFDKGTGAVIEQPLAFFN